MDSVSRATMMTEMQKQCWQLVEHTGGCILGLWVMGYGGSSFDDRKSKASQKFFLNSIQTKPCSDSMPSPRDERLTPSLPLQVEDIHIPEPGRVQLLTRGGKHIKVNSTITIKYRHIKVNNCVIYYFLFLIYSCIQYSAGNMELYSRACNTAFVWVCACACVPISYPHVCAFVSFVPSCLFCERHTISVAGTGLKCTVLQTVADVFTAGTHACAISLLHQQGLCAKVVPNTSSAAGATFKQAYTYTTSCCDLLWPPSLCP